MTKYDITQSKCNDIWQKLNYFVAYLNKVNVQRNNI